MTASIRGILYFYNGSFLESHIKVAKCWSVLCKHNLGKTERKTVGFFCDNKNRFNIVMCLRVVTILSKIFLMSFQGPFFLVDHCLFYISCVFLGKKVGGYLRIIFPQIRINWHFGELCELREHGFPQRKVGDDFNLAMCPDD